MATCEFGTQEIYNNGEETTILELTDVRGGGGEAGEPCQHWYKIRWALKDGKEQQPTWMSEAGLQKESQGWRIGPFWVDPNGFLRNGHHPKEVKSNSKRGEKEG